MTLVEIVAGHAGVEVVDVVVLDPQKDPVGQPPRQRDVGGPGQRRGVPRVLRRRGPVPLQGRRDGVVLEAEDGGADDQGRPPRRELELEPEDAGEGGDGGEAADDADDARPVVAQEAAEGLGGREARTVACWVCVCERERERQREEEGGDGLRARGEKWVFFSCFFSLSLSPPRLEKRKRKLFLPGQVLPKNSRYPGAVTKWYTSGSLSTLARTFEALGLQALHSFTVQKTVWSASKSISSSTPSRAWCLRWLRPKFAALVQAQIPETAAAIALALREVKTMPWTRSCMRMTVRT